LRLEGLGSRTWSAGQPDDNGKRGAAFWRISPERRSFPDAHHGDFYNVYPVFEEGLT
jgi:hypothetical protein